MAFFLLDTLSQHDDTVLVGEHLGRSKQDLRVAGSTYNIRGRGVYWASLGLDIAWHGMYEALDLGHGYVYNR